MITAVMIDSREPDFFKSLKFGGVPTMVAMLETGDVQAVTDDGHTLVIERKTPDDFLNTLRDERLFPQLARMTETRCAQQTMGEPITNWPYLVITDLLKCNHDGKLITDRGVTGWSWASVMGTLLSIQEMGVFVVFANGAADYEDCILRLGKRSRKPITIMPARPSNVLGPKAAFLGSLPGIGPDNVQKILEWSNNNVGHALIGLTDFEVRLPPGLGAGIRRRVRELMSLADGANLRLDEPECEPVQGEKGKDYA